MKTLLLPLLLALSAPCFGQESASDVIQSDLIKAPDHADPGGYFTVRTPPGLEYKIEPEPVEFLRTVEEGTGVRVLFVLYAKAPGYTITIDHAVIHPTEAETKAAPWDDRVKFAEWLAKHSKDEVYRDSHTVKVGKQPDPPTPPDPPGPTPDPDVKPPIPEPGFRVMFLIEKEKNLPSLQRAIIAGKEVDEYLRKTCIDETSGQEGWRVFDVNQDVSTELPVWQKAMENAKPESLPWVLISNGRTGIQCALPASPSAFIELCRKYEVK